jgi:transposase
MGMSIVYERCAGLDIHKQTVVACLLLTTPTSKATREVRTFATTTAGLLALADWLASQGVTHLDMESTGIYWRPVYAILEGRMQVILVNAAHMKAVPGRKVRREVA